MPAKKKPFTLGSEKGSIIIFNFKSSIFNYLHTLSLPTAPCSRIIIRPLSRFRLFILYAFY